MPAAAATLTRGPYLQLLTTHSVTVIWQTDTVAACGLAIHPVDGPGKTTLVAGDVGTLCVIPVDGLAAGAHFAYTPLGDGHPLDSEAVFRTDDPTQPYTFLVVGDHGDHEDSSQQPVRDRMVATPADFIISVGDMVYPDGAAERFDSKFFTPYRELLRKLVFWPCLGNHDEKDDDSQAWKDAFYTPANNPAGDEDYYSFDAGNAHVVVLESNNEDGEKLQEGSPEYTFLDQDLTTTTATWTVVVFHHTVYSSGLDHGSAIRLRERLVPLLDLHAVDLVLTGHEHVYERTKPLRGDEVVEPGAGTVYITTAGGGANLTGVGTSSFTAYSESAFHFVRIAGNGPFLEAQMIRADGSVGDSVTLTKSSTPPACVSVASCDDGDPCTRDTCDPFTGCRHELPGVSVLQSAVEHSVVDTCIDQPLPRKIDKLVARAAAQVGRVAASPKRAPRLLRRAKGQIHRSERIALKAGRKGKISRACSEGLRTAFEAIPFECALDL